MTRAEKRREWKNSWKDFIAKPDEWIIQRQGRRINWKLSWNKFKNMNELEMNEVKVEEVIG